jgi:NTP pyrophosphatase (non-canonical NTP hydrolase)|nr:MAG TPA: hypothetical protein [Crassvirales sp.]
MYQGEFNWGNLALIGIEIHKNAVNKGFWDEELPPYHYQGMIVSELGEMINAHRAGLITKINLDELINETDDEKFKKRFEEEVKNNWEDEAADVAIRALDALANNGESEMRTHLMDTLEMIDQKIKKTLEEEGRMEAYKELSMPSHVWFIMRAAAKIDLEYGFVGSLCHIIAEVNIIAELMGIDLMKHIQIKMRYNEMRPYKHGKNY